MSAAPAPKLRRQGAGARRGKRGWEYGYWMVDDKTDTRVFQRVGFARTMEAALKHVEKL